MLTYEQIKQILDEYDVPNEYSHFTEQMTPPFIAWIAENSDNFNADNKVCAVVKEFTVELYSRVNTPLECEKLEAFFNEKGLSWEKVNETWISEDKVNMSVYSVSGKKD